MSEGEFALVRQYIEEALHKVASPVKWGSMPSELDLYALLADGAARMRDEAALRQYAPLLEAMAARLPHKLYLGVAHRALGVGHALAGEYSEAAARLDRAQRLFRGLKTRWQVGRTLHEMGELALAQGDAPAARAHFTRALTAFEKMGAAPDAARTRSRMG